MTASCRQSLLVNWLIYPTELAEVPHEIELMKVMPVEDGKRDFYLFRFRMLAPHPAAKVGWMAGIAGTFVAVDPVFVKLTVVVRLQPTRSKRTRVAPPGNVSTPPPPPPPPIHG